MEELSRKQKITVLIGILLGLLLSALDTTIIGTAMPEIVRRLGGMEHYSWVTTAYMLFATTAIPIFGKLADLYGRKIFYLLGMVIFLTGSALCGFAANMTELILFRAFQGLGGGVMMSNSFALVGDIFPPAERAKYQGLMGAAFGFACIIGPGLGGFITDNLNWRWVFFVNLPIGIAALAFITAFLPNRKSDHQNKTIDYPGLVTLTLTLFPMLLGFSLAGKDYDWLSPQIIGLFATSIIMLYTFIRVEAKAKDPVIPLTLFRNPIFNVAVTARFLSNAGMFGAIMFIPLFVQMVVGTSATNSGIIITPMMITMICASIISGQIVSHTGKYRILSIIGLAVMAAGMWLCSRMTVDTSNAETIRNMMVIGLGLGVITPILVMVVQNAFPYKQLGVVTSAVQLFGNAGITIGMAIMGSIMNNRFTREITAGIDTIPAVFRKMIPPKILATLTSGSLDQLTELVYSKQTSLQLPKSPLTTKLMGQFGHILKSALANSIGSIFFFSFIITLLAFVISFWLKEIPLRRSHHSPLEDMGMELAADAPGGAPTTTEEMDPAGDENR